VLLIPPGRDRGGDKIHVMSTLSRLYLIIALTASHLTISYDAKRRGAAALRNPHSTQRAQSTGVSGGRPRPGTPTPPPLAVYLP